MTSDAARDATDRAPRRAPGRHREPTAGPMLTGDLNHGGLADAPSADIVRLKHKRENLLAHWENLKVKNRFELYTVNNYLSV